MTAAVLSGWYWQALCVATALACGLLIGIERGWKLKDQKPGTRVAGVRTFTMMGLGSGIAGLLGASLDMSSSLRRSPSAWSRSW